MTLSPAATRTTELDAAFESERAFRAWYDRTLPRVYAYVASHTGGDRDLAEEITQQAFIEALRSHRSFDGRADSVTWLCSIARHRLADHFRRLDREERRRIRVVVRELDPPADAAMWRAVDARETVEAALRTLPSLQRAALIFMYVDGLTVREIAGALDRSETAAESLLARARTNFRRAIGADHD